MSKQILPFSTLALVCSVASATAYAQENAAASLSIGTVRDKAEAAAVRVIAKYGETLSVTDKLFPKEVSGDRGLFLTLSRQIKIDATDKGRFGGVLLRYGIKRYSVGMKTDPDAPPTVSGKPVVKFDGDKLMHVVPIQIGFDADRNFKNKDLLLEVGYIPALFRSGDSCFKLGANPIVGVSGQLGRRQRGSEPTEPGKAAESSGSLKRAKLEAKIDFPLSCVFAMPAATDASSTDPFRLIFGDVGRWQLALFSTSWRDFSESRNYRKHELTLRIPTSDKTFFELKREIGAAPTEFDTGAKFGANLTVQF